MSSITGVDSNFGFESLNIAMNKRAQDEQGAMTLSLLESTVQGIEQVNAQAAAQRPQGNLGQNVNVYA